MATSIVCLVIAGCAGSQGRHYAYKITEEGPARTGEERKFEGIGEQTFVKTQKYRITLTGDGAKPFHLLLANVKLKVGGKVVDEANNALIPITDGFYQFECTRNYSERLSTSIDDVPPPTCEFTLLGVIEPTASASVVRG